MPTPALVPTGDRDDEIDLSPYFKVVAKHYRLVLGVAIIAALIGAGVALTAPKTYVAQASIVVTPPLYVLNLDLQSQSTQGQNLADIAAQRARALLSLALTDDVLNVLISTGGAGSPKEPKSTDDLRQIFQVESGSDPSLIILTVRNPDPQQAATLANAWADALVLQGQSVYGGNTSDLTYLQGTVVTASDNLSKAEAALVDFEAHSQVSILSARLTVLKLDQQTYLADREEVNRLNKDVQGLRSHLGQYSPSAKVSLSDDLTALALETEVFGASTSVPVQVQVNSTDGVSTKTAAELQGTLDDLEAQLTSRSNSDQARIDQMTPQIPDLQGQVQKITSDENRLTTERDNAKSIYQALTQQTEAVRLAPPSANSQIRIASHASAPTRPSQSHTAILATAFGGAGLLIGIVLALVLELWRPQATAATALLPKPRSSPASVVAGADGAGE
jgi:uncharacterized protein involved in exopolysaccharide biosynthesis